MLNKYPLNQTIKEMKAHFEKNETRYLSWEYCYIFFQDNIKNSILSNKRINDETIDIACLHLGFYLASWGMMRGSTFLLNHHYKVHEKFIRKIVVSDKYKELWDKDIADTSLLFELIDDIKSTYKEFDNREATDTLCTKIALGIWGCTPAYDRFFKAGLKQANILTNNKYNFSQNLSEKSYDNICRFYNEYKYEINKIKISLKDSNYTYPPMKIIDMYFLNLGKV